MRTETRRITAGGLRAGIIALWFSGFWQRVLRLNRRSPRRLRLCESLPLGERRFVAVVEFDRARFLVGGTPSSLMLLSRLGDAGGRAQGDAEAEIEAQRGETC